MTKTANKAGTYENFTGTIDWFGTKGRVTNASFTLTDGLDWKVEMTSGTWESGTCGDGWFGGDAVWRDGIWKRGVFCGSATWKGGTWEDGWFCGYAVWEGGVWKAGDFYGWAVWKGGVWESGYFRDHAVWEAGTWQGGTFGTRSLLHDHKLVGDTVWKGGHDKDGEFHSDPPNKWKDVARS